VKTKADIPIAGVPELEGKHTIENPWDEQKQSWQNSEGNQGKECHDDIVGN